jgi:V8-like Glu-specific endopeptidase
MKLKAHLPWLLILAMLFAYLPFVLAQSKPMPPLDRAVLLKSATGGSCSGVILQTNEVLTAKHCVAAPLTLDGNQAQILKVDPENDLALLLSKTPIIERVNIADAGVEQEVISYGHPQGIADLMFSKGYVMNVREQYLLVSNITLPGDSGAPLFTPGGQLVGLMVQLAGTNGFDFPLGVAVPSRKIKSFLGW